MAHVLISYSSVHVEQARDIVTFLKGCGLDVWWDEDIPARGPWKGELYHQLKAATGVVVLWTPEAITSDWVLAEARHAHSKNMLINVVAKGVKSADLPPPFNDYQRHLPFETGLILRDVLAVRAGRLLLADKREALPPDRPPAPLQLLQAKFAVVPFADGGGTKGDMLDWALSRGSYATDPRRAAGRLIHGPGGLGKTRLLIEVAEELRDAGWSAGFLERPQASHMTVTSGDYAKAISFFIRGATDNGRLLVMDYAEGRAGDIARLAAQIEARAADETRPIRLVLLARGAGEWWRELHHQNADVQALFARDIVTSDVIELPLLATSAQRLDLFWSAFREFAAALPQADFPTPTQDHDATRLTRIRSGEGYERPLAVQMEALLYLLGASPDAQAKGIHHQLPLIMGAEIEHWKNLLGDLKGEHGHDPTYDLKRAVAQVTGLQGVPQGEAAERLFMADRYYSNRVARGDVRHVHTNIATVYGHGGDIVHLEPDLIGEHHLATIADKELIDSCLAWIDTQPKTERSTYRRDLLTVLQRATQPEHGIVVSSKAISHLDYIIINHLRVLAADMVAVIIDTSGELCLRIERLAGTLAEEPLAALNAVLPHQSVALTALSLVVAECRVDLGRAAVAAAGVGDRETLHAELVKRLTTLSVRHYQSGRPQLALQFSTECVQLARSSVKSGLTHLLPSLAIALNAQAAALASVKDLPRAVVASGEFLLIARTLHREDPGRYLEDLAVAFDNFTRNLRNMGNSRAIKTAERTMVLYEQLFAIDPEKYGVQYINGLRTAASVLPWINKKNEALELLRLAVVKAKEISLKDPDQFQPEVAASLSALGHSLMQGPLDERRVAEAQAAFTEAAGINTKLATARPESFLPALAENYVAICRIYMMQGNNLLAAVISKTGLHYLMPLLEKEPKRVDGVCRELRRLHMEASKEADKEPDEQLLGRLTRTLGVDEAPEEQPPEIREAMNLLKEVLDKASREGSLDEDLMVRLPTDLADQVRTQMPTIVAKHALEAHQRAPELVATFDPNRAELDKRRSEVQQLRDFAKVRPDEYIPQLTDGLMKLALVLMADEKIAEATDTIWEAVAIARRLVDERGERLRPLLSMSLGAASSILRTAGRPAESVAATREAIEVLLPLLRSTGKMFDSLARQLGREHYAASEEAGQEPDNALLQKVVSALKNDTGDQDDGVKVLFEALMAAHERTGELDESLMAKLPPTLAQQIRSGWPGKSRA